MVVFACLPGIVEADKEKEIDVILEMQVNVRTSEGIEERYLTCQSCERSA